MVEGAGLENQRRKRPQVRILSFPPKLYFFTPHHYMRFFIFQKYVIIIKSERCTLKRRVQKIIRGNNYEKNLHNFNVNHHLSRFFF